MTRFRLRPRLALAALCSAAVLGAAGSAVAVASPEATATRATRTHTVAIRKIAFTPATLRIRRGDRVRWTWGDGPATAHNVTSRGKLRFKSASTRINGAYTVRFRHQGTYAYVCTLHLGMRGKIIVR